MVLRSWNGVQRPCGISHFSAWHCPSYNQVPKPPYPPLHFKNPTRKLLFDFKNWKQLSKNILFDLRPALVWQLFHLYIKIRQFFKTIKNSEIVDNIWSSGKLQCFFWDIYLVLVNLMDKINFAYILNIQLNRTLQNFIYSFKKTLCKIYLFVSDETNLFPFYPHITHNITCFAFPVNMTSRNPSIIEITYNGHFFLNSTNDNSFGNFLLFLI